MSTEQHAQAGPQDGQQDAPAAETKPEMTVTTAQIGVVGASWGCGLANGAGVMAAVMFPKVLRPDEQSGPSSTTIRAAISAAHARALARIVRTHRGALGPHWGLPEQSITVSLGERDPQKPGGDLNVHVFAPEFCGTVVMQSELRGPVADLLERYAQMDEDRQKAEAAGLVNDASKGFPQ